MRGRGLVAAADRVGPPKHTWPCRKGKKNQNHLFPVKYDDIFSLLFFRFQTVDFATRWLNVKRVQVGVKNVYVRALADASNFTTRVFLGARAARFPAVRLSTVFLIVYISSIRSRLQHGHEKIGDADDRTDTTARHGQRHERRSRIAAAAHKPPSLLRLS